MIVFLELLLKIPIDIAAFLIRKIKEWCTWQGKYIKQTLPESFRKEYLGHTQIYVQPFITPNRISLDHPETTDSGKQELLKDYFITKVFTDTTDEPTVICLLGDSGSGKSSALVHLLHDYIHHYKSKGQLPFPHIKLLSLRNQMDFHAIDSIPDKEHTILLLDALDECPQVQSSEDFERFLTALRNAYSDFARVVITCRPQFFPDNDHQSVLTPNDISNEVSFLQCENRYLAPFNNTQIDSFLSHKFSFRHDSSAYKDACEIINQAPLLFIRPLVLTYIDILIKSQQPIKTPLDVHYCIIHELLKRDIGLKIFSGNVEQRVRNWWQLSAIAAAHMYQRGKQSLTDKEFDELLNKSENKKILSSDKARNFKRRSLLTRTGDEYHFSHRSFFEFFLAYHFLLHPDEIGYIRGLDFALEIFDQLYDAFTKGDKKPFSMLDAEVNEEHFAFAYLNISNRLYDLNHFSKALPRGQKAVDIFSRLSQTNPEAYRQHKATALNNLATLHVKTNNLAAAEEEYTEALSTYRSFAEANPEDFLPDVAMTLNNLAVLHDVTNNPAAAEEEYTEALSTYRSLAEANPEDFLPDVATTLNNLAVLHYATIKHATAEEEYTEALSTYRSLAEAHPDAFLPDVAMTLNNLANLHAVNNNLTAAEEEYTEALSIRRSLAEANPDAFLPYVATTLNNLGTLHSDTNNHAAAEKEYTEALSIHRSLAEANPDAFLPDVAQTLNNLALLHADTNNHAAAEEEYTEALSTYRSLAEANPDAFLPDVATTLNNLAILHADTNNHTAAEEEYIEALSTYRSLAEANPDAFLPYVATTLNNLGTLHSRTNNHAAAEKEYTEALSTYRSLAEANPDAFLPDVATTLNNLANLHRRTNNHADAEEEYTEALSTYRSLAEAHPDAFLPHVAHTLFNIALLHLQKGELDEAERAAQESLDKYRTMAEKSHAAFDMNVKKGEEFLADIQKLRTEVGGTE